MEREADATEFEAGVAFTAALYCEGRTAWTSGCSFSCTACCCCACTPSVPCLRFIWGWRRWCHGGILSANRWRAVGAAAVARPALHRPLPCSPRPPARKAGEPPPPPSPAPSSFDPSSAVRPSVSNWSSLVNRTIGARMAATTSRGSSWRYPPTCTSTPTLQLKMIRTSAIEDYVRVVRALHAVQVANGTAARTRLTHARPTNPPNVDGFKFF